MRLIPIVVLVTDETQRALSDYVAHVEKIIGLDAPDLELALAAATGSGWTPEMLIAGQLLNHALDEART